MNSSVNRLKVVIVASFALALSACSGMSQQERHTAYGATAGGVAGALISGGVLGTAGGAAVGGLIGHELGKDKKKK